MIVVVNMNLFEEIGQFLSHLAFVDIVFFIAIITLLILIVTLIYFIKINRDDPGKDNDLPSGPPSQNDDKNAENSEDLNAIVENITTNEPGVNNEYDDEEGELLDLEKLTKKLQEQEDGERISCNEYEKNQEEKAIISYDELLQKHNQYALNYEKEEVVDDLVIKKVDLNDLENKNEEAEVIGVKVISYDKEEAFLKALKELNSLLN